MSNRLTKPALNWLEQVMAERFGYQFVLSYELNSRMAIRLSGSNAVVLIDTENCVFNQPGKTMQCIEWHAEAEGWSSVFKKSIPAPGVDFLTHPLIIVKTNTITISYDILGLTYWMLNRIEEIGSQHFDNHRRFMCEKSHGHKYGYVDRPIVDEWLHILGQVIQRTWPSLNLKQNIFKLEVSHDVDLPSFYAYSSAKKIFKTIAIDIFKHHNLENAIKTPLFCLASRKVIQSQDPYNTFEWLMNISDQFGLTSKFNFICGANCRYDAAYSVDDIRIRKLMVRINERGHEIGLHPSYQAYDNADMIVREAGILRRIMYQENIQQKKLGSRMHYLRWKHPTTLQAINDAKIDFDSTLGYAERAGFRCGTCFEYPGFNTETQQKMSVRIRPLIAMEGSVIRSEYMGLGIGDQAFREFIMLKEKCRLVGGCFTLLWHNSDLETECEKELYKSVVSM